MSKQPAVRRVVRAIEDVLVERDRREMHAVEAVLAPFEREQRRGTSTDPVARNPWRGFRTVLCPIDFSKHSSLALRYADVIARQANARLLVQYVNDPLVVAAAGAAFHDRSLATTS